MSTTPVHGGGLLRLVGELGQVGGRQQLGRGDGQAYQGDSEQQDAGVAVPAG